MEDEFSCSLFCYVLIQIIHLQVNTRNRREQCWDSELQHKAWKSGSWADCRAATISYPVKMVILVVVPLCCGGGFLIGAVSLIGHLCSNNLGQQNYEPLNQPPYHFLRLKPDADFVLEIHLHLLFHHRTWLVRNFMTIAFPFGRNFFPFCFPFWEEAYCIP